jgi:hypothetical protein
MNLTNKVLKSESYTKFLKNAADDRSFYALSDHKKKKERGLMYKRPTPEMHEVQKTPPPKSPGQFNMTSVKNTPGGSRVVRSKRGLNYRLPMSGSPLPFEKDYKRRKMQRTHSPKSPLQIGKVMNTKEKKQLFAQFKNIEVKQYKKGGLVRKTGLALVHKGELVIPVNKVAEVRRALAMYKRRTSKK